MLRRSEIANANHLGIVTVTQSYQMTGNEDVLLVDATAAAVTITLPNVVGNKNASFVIKKIDSSGNAVTVNPLTSTVTIDGSSSASLSSQYATLALLSDGVNWQIKTVSASGTFTGGTITGATTVSVASATALVVGPNGTTNPTLTVDTNTASAATGLLIKSAAAAGGLALSVLSSGTNENLTIDSKGSGTITLNTTGTGRIISMRGITIQTNSASGIVVGAGGSTNPVFQVDGSVASQTTGLKITGKASGAGVAITLQGGGTNENLNIDGKGTGTTVFQSATAVPAGGAVGAAVLMSSTASLGVYFGSGAPTVSAAQGSLYIRTDGSSTSTRLYVNTNGSTTWTNVTTAA